MIFPSIDSTHRLNPNQNPLANLGRGQEDRHYSREKSQHDNVQVTICSKLKFLVFVFPNVKNNSWSLPKFSSEDWLSNFHYCCRESEDYRVFLLQKWTPGSFWPDLPNRSRRFGMFRDQKVGKMYSSICPFCVIIVVSWWIIYNFEDENYWNQAAGV